MTASQLAQDSPILPHKMNGGYAQPPDARVTLVGYNSDTKVPPAVPPRTRENSVNRQFQTLNGNGNPGLATVKRNSMSRTDGKAVLEEVFRASTLSRRDARDSRVPFRREASVPRTNANWSDSLPRKDLFISQTGSLPRRDKAGLGRPEPPRPAQAPEPEKPKDPPRDPAPNRENPFRDAFLGTKNMINQYF